MNWNRIAALCAQLAILLAMLISPSFANLANAQSTIESTAERNRATFDELEQRVITVDFFEKRFEDVLVMLSNESNLKFEIDESAADNSLDAESLITRKFSDVRLATVLEFLVDEFQCTWAIRDGIVVIMSQDASLDIQNMATRVIDCADLIDKIKPITETYRPGGGSSGMHPPVVGRAGRQGGGVFVVSSQPQEDGEAVADDKNAAAQEASAEDGSIQPSTPTTPSAPTAPTVAPSTFEVNLSGRDQLIELIIETVDPDSWEVNGGNGRVMGLNNLIVVVQTQKNLRDLEGLLGQLRSTKLEE